MANSRVAPPTVTRSVKPRSRTFKPMPVVAIGGTDFLAESGETGTVTDLVDRLPDYSPTLFCKLGAADFVAMLNSVYLLRTPTSWKWRAHTSERNMSAPNGGPVRAVRVTVPINYFGWERSKGDGFHRIIDPVTMYGKALGEIWPDDASVVQDAEWQNLTKLLRWGMALRDFCAEQDIQVRPTIGSMAAQFLTDRRFYPKARRKVPMQINERARENLPGNHYYLNVVPDPSNNFTVHYLDQHRAHHHHARTTPLPDSDSCFAYGRFSDLSTSFLGRTDSAFLGLYCLDLSAPARCAPFDWIVGKLDAQFVYSNELPHLLDMGYRVRAVRAAWGSLKRDTGLRRYACWSEEQLDRYTDAPWLKPILLATYGVLATRPMNRESIFRLANSGTPVKVRTGRRELNGLRVQSPRKLEPGIAHVLQRGMIEAACRSESIGLAQWLDHLGHRVLSIYADAVMVEADDDNDLPLLLDPWRCKRTLSHLQYINQQAFTSDGMTKLPGIGRELTQYRQRTMPGYAPRVVQYEALTGKSVTTARRI